MDEAFGHWIAGFIDGEGCFTIEDRRSGPPYLYTHFGLAVRADDAGIVERIHGATGLGHVFHRRAYGKAKPQVVWKIAKQEDCRGLVNFLSQFPLRAKKANDFSIWGDAVEIQSQLHGTERYEAMLSLRETLMSGRKFQP